VRVKPGPWHTQSGMKYDGHFFADGQRAEGEV
jgi:hypothetical protein